MMKAKTDLLKLLFHRHSWFPSAHVFPTNLTRTNTIVYGSANFSYKASE